VQIGVLGGTGPEGKALAVRLASVGIDVVIGSRSHDRAIAAVEELKAKWPDHELPLKGADNQDAAQAPLLVIATPWDAAASTALSVAEHLDGKVVISIANALARVGDEFQALIPARGSVAVHVQATVPASRVVAAFHHLPARALGAIDRPMDGDVLVCADDDAARAEASALVSAIPALRPLDAGTLSNASAVEAFTAVLLGINLRYKTRATVRLTGIEAD
jgi:NADPH-dependent F420 reductase